MGQQVTRTNTGLTKQTIFDFSAILKLPTLSPITLVDPPVGKIVIPTLFTAELKWVANFTNITSAAQDMNFGWPSGIGTYAKICDNGVLAKGASGLAVKGIDINVGDGLLSNFLGPLAMYIVNTGNFTGGAAGSRFLVTVFYNLLSV